MTTKLASAVCALSLVFCGSAATVHTASAQAQSVPAPPLAGPPSPEQVQPWGLPPPPPGIGPVTLFADVHDHAKLVPAFNCNPKGDLGPACEPQGTRWHDGKLYVTTRHLGVLVYDPRS